ncbi:MAG: restriction endonuclease subunit S [Bacteroidota bacterium]
MLERLPQGWVKTTLGEVCAINPRPAFDELPPEETEVSFVPMAAVEEETGRMDPSEVRPLAIVRKGYTPFIENDVVFAKITPCMENGKIAMATGLKNGLAYGSTEFFVFRPYEGVLPRFLLYFLLQRSFRNEAEGTMSGAVGQKRVPLNHLFSHAFPLPPTGEQERIVLKLKATFSMMERAERATQRALENLQRYRASILEATWKGKWPRRRLGALTLKIGSGSTPRGGEAVYQESGIPLIRSLNVHSTGFRFEGLAFIDDAKAKKLENAIVGSGDVLLNITGASIGRVTTVPASLDGARVNQHVCIIRPNQDLLSEFLAMFLASPSEQARIKHVQVGATRPALTKAMIVNWEVPVPPLSLQSKIVAKAKRQLLTGARMVVSLEQQLDRARATRQSLLREAFGGRLVPQDPKDEPASVLLDRIRAIREAEANKQKGKRMHKLKPKSVRRPLLEVLREHSKPMTPEQLYREAGFQPEEVDVFYRELASLRDILREEKPSASEVKAWPHRAHVVLELKET